MGRRYIREQRTECGEKYAEVDLFWVNEAEHKAGPRRKKELASSLAQQKRNVQHSKRYFTQLIHCNFDKRGFHLALTYDDAFLPEDEEWAARDLENYLRRVRWWLKKRGHDPAGLKWIAVTEHQDADKAAGVKEVRYHHHLLIQHDGLDKSDRSHVVL